MLFHPHKYQEYAVDFILSHPVAAVLLDMGLGKTVITLTAVERLLHDSFEVSRVLVVAPLRVAAMTWPNEIAQWDHLSSLSYAVAVGTPEERRAAVLQGAEITIINRENLKWLVNESGLHLNYDMLVIDELTSFKNPKSQRFKAFIKLRPRATRVVGLTGTPSSNGLMDLYAEYRCLDMGERLGRFIGQYRAAYFIPDRMSGQMVYSYRPRPGAREQIYDKIRDITVSMKALDHLPMPDLISTRCTVQLSGEEREVYDDMRDELIVDLNTEGESLITAANAAALSTKLCQLANGCVYTDDGDPVEFHSRKLDALEDLLESATSPVLVAYWYRHDLARIKARLTEKEFSFAELRDPESISLWNEGKIPIGLIHPASAGHGLNLQQGGHHVIWYSLTWSLELYEQVNARLWRQGQQARTVVITHIITRDTIDESILHALRSKAATQNALIEAVKAALPPSK